MATATFVDGTFDAIVDKGGLDAVMEPELGPKLGSQYLSERYQEATSYLPFVFEGSSPSAGKLVSRNSSPLITIQHCPQDRSLLVNAQLEVHPILPYSKNMHNHLDSTLRNIVRSTTTHLHSLFFDTGIQEVAWCYQKWFTNINVRGMVVL
ncbi:hypothetical protein LguiB_028771 [Lonicera macranthoides]